MHQITCCRSCGNKHIEPFFDLGCQPFANGLVRDRTVNDPTYPLSLSWCPECSLVQLNHTADPTELFSHYFWVTSTSSTARSYSESFCNMVLKHAGSLNDSSYVFEVASNDGTFLKPFIGHGLKVLGVDPAENVVEMALADRVPTMSGFFGQKMAENIISEHDFPSMVIARNVLPHVANIHDFLKGIRQCMTDGGLLVAEIHYAKTILDELHYDSIYHEHLCYFTLKSFEWLLNSYDLHIYDIMESPISGGSIVVFASLSQREKSPVVIEYERQERLSLVNELASWKSFARTAYEHRKLLVELLNEELSNGSKVAGYGASARSSTMLNFCSIGTDTLTMIADQNPMKQKLFTPGTHIPIDRPEKVMSTKPDTVLILAWNFLSEIAELLWRRFDFDGKLIVPLPYPPKLATIQEVVNG